MHVAVEDAELYDRPEPAPPVFVGVSGPRQARFCFAVPGWKVMAELPDIVSFEAATSTVRPDDVTEMVPAGNDPDAVAAGIQRFLDAGFEHVAVVQVGDDIEGFLEAWPDIRSRLP